MRFTLLLAAGLLASTAAGAVTLVYDIAGAPGTANASTYRFELDSERAPDLVTSGSFRFFNVPVTYRLPGDTADRTVVSGVTFRTLFDGQGGLLIGFLPTGNFFLFNTELFTGPVSDPTLLTGTFALSTTPRNNAAVRPFDDYIVRVGEPVAAIPEPATWGMMIAGFGLVGGALRRRAPARA